MSREQTGFISTGQAARLLGVTPDTVLKWVKTGRLPAVRTPGGHFRIARRDVAASHDQAPAEALAERKDGPAVLHCWEYHARNGEVRTDCQQCLVYRARALRCYEMSSLPPGAGYAGTFCKTSCAECPYYQEQVRRKVRVLVVTDSVRLRELLRADAQSSSLHLEFASCEYEASSVVDWFRPEYVVIDCAHFEERCSELCANISADPRIPGVGIVLASPGGGWAGPRSNCKVVGEVPSLVSCLEMEKCIAGLNHNPFVEEKKASA